MVRPDFREFNNCTELYHYGMPRRSGRYPWGSGKRPFQGDSYKRPSRPGKVMKTLKTMRDKELRNIKEEATIRYYKSDEDDRNTPIEKISDLPKKRLSGTLADDIIKSNPDIRDKHGVNAKKSNPINCVSAIEMRRRGYDVQARSGTMPNSSYDVDTYKKLFKNLKFESKKYPSNPNETSEDRNSRAYNDMMKSISSYGDGSRGVLLEVTKDDNSNKRSAYSNYYWVVKNGRTKLYNPTDWSDKLGVELDFANMYKPENYRWARLDNLELNPKITEVVRSRKKTGLIDLYKDPSSGKYLYKKSLESSLRSPYYYNNYTGMYYYHGLTSNSELYHFGIPRRSGRYPWGSGARPFQSGGGPMSKRQAKKAEKLRTKEISKMTPEEREAEKQRVLKTGTATEVLRYKGELTNQEMREAVDRINLETRLKDLSQKDIKSGMEQIDNIMKGVKMGTDWIKIGTDTWNTLARIYNSTEEGQKNPLTLVGEGKKKKGGD